MVTVVSSSSKLAPVSLKSKRCVNSRTAWSTALVNSCVSISDTTSNEGMLALLSLCQQLIQGVFHLGHELNVVIAGGGTGIPRMNLANVAFAVDEDRSGKGHEALQHGQFLGCLVLIGDAGDQRGVFDAVVLPEALRSLRGALEISKVLELQRHDLQTLVAIVLVKRCEERCLVMAIRAPAAGQRHDEHLAPKLRILGRHDLSREVGKCEIECLDAGTHGRHAVGIRQLGGGIALA